MGLSVQSHIGIFTAVMSWSKSTRFERMSLIKEDTAVCYRQMSSATHQHPHENPAALALATTASITPNSRGGFTKY